ncbi:hypothetical protein EYC59_05080 [Candidatus Saccharibacteria bacterium]|nr:MAG: hypothetical protein EYC59_05080 [Candidatus Saccharibacteria bacterium]
MIPAVILSVSATLGSIIILTRIAVSTHSRTAPKSLSERAALEQTLLLRFRNTLLLCSTLFAVAVYFFIAPAAPYPWFIVGAWTLEYVGVIIAAILPAKGKTFYPHVAAAQSMGAGMLLLAFAFWKNTTGVGSALELGLALAMTIFAVLIYTDKCRYIFHELAFIYLSHFTIVLAALLIA